MTDKFEKTFEIAVPVERAWELFTDPKELDAWVMCASVAEFEPWPGGRYVTEREGLGQSVAEIHEAEPHRRLRWTEPPGIIPAATEVTVTFEGSESGTRVTVTQSGFGDGEEWLGYLDGFTLGWLQSIADLQLYVRTGISFNRWFTWRSDLGAITIESPAGVEVAAVTPGSFADQAGARPGDILLRAGSMPIFWLSDVWAFTREHAAGEECELTCARKGEVVRGRGVLGAFGLTNVGTEK